MLQAKPPPYLEVWFTLVLPSSPNQFSSVRIRNVIFAFPLPKVVDGTNRTVSYCPVYSPFSTEASPLSFVPWDALPDLYCSCIQVLIVWRFFLSSVTGKDAFLGWDQVTCPDLPWSWVIIHPSIYPASYDDVMSIAVLAWHIQNWGFNRSWDQGGKEIDRSHLLLIVNVEDFTDNFICTKWKKIK